MKTSEVLTNAKQLIATPDKWAQGDYSKEDQNGDTCYCALGALAKVIGCENHMIHVHRSADLLRDIVIDYVGGGLSFAEYNDHKTHAEVMAVFDKAIELAKAEQD